MTIETLEKYTFGDSVVEYLYDRPEETTIQDDYGLTKPGGTVGMRIYPAALADKLARRRDVLDPFAITGVLQTRAWNLEPLVQFKLLGDEIDGYHQGLSMRNSSSLASLRLEGQRLETDGDTQTVVTRLISERGYACEHRLSWQQGAPGFGLKTIFENTGSSNLTLEMLASFSLGSISPFACDDAPEQLFVHRFRSNWSAEGRHERLIAEALHLERSWMGLSAHSERFGHLGSMPARGFFPCAAIEDHETGVLWGAQLYTPGSWQMEFYRLDDQMVLSGGLPDREFGHWMKTIAPGERFASPEAIVATAQGDIDDLCARLVELQEARIHPVPSVEDDLPVACNEWCTSWGDPHHEDIVAMADRLQGSGVRYLTIDCGWYKKDGGNWMLAQGDWEANPRLFPKGLAGAAQAIRERGLIPGLWFEMEVVGSQSPRFNETTHFLKRDGLPVTASGRRFLDFRDPWVKDYLLEKVVGQLRDSGFGYVKLDYNETIGIGVDGADSLGEGLRQHMEGVLSFFDTLRTELPDLVIENCASGGQRLAPAFLMRASQASFSDAFENVQIPILAASEHRLVPPRQMQVWAVLRAGDSLKRLHYSLAAGFLGRLCLSGEIAQLSEEQWQVVEEALGVYRLAAPVIRAGRSRFVQASGASWEHPQGAQALVRVSADGSQALVVYHSFAAPHPLEVNVPLPDGDWRIKAAFPAAGPAPQLRAGMLVIPVGQAFEGAAWVLERNL